MQLYKAYLRLTIITSIINSIYIMKKDNLFTLMLGVLIMLTTSSCINGPIIKGSKNYITKKTTLEKFNVVTLSGSANIIYQQDSSSRIEIYGSDNIIDIMNVKVDKGELNIKFKKNVHIVDLGKLEIKIYSPDLNQMTINGSGGILFANGIRSQEDLKVTINGSGNLAGSSFQCRELSLAIHGSGDLRLKQINCEECDASISGSGDISLNGSAKEASYSISGSGDIKAAGLEAVTVSARISGSGDISCFATDKLEGGVSGSGTVAYKGNPHSINIPQKRLRKLD